MENLTWIISINSDYLSPAKLFRFIGTKSEAEQKLYDMYLEDYHEEVSYKTEIEADPCELCPITDIEYDEQNKTISFTGMFDAFDDFGDSVPCPISYQAIEVNSIPVVE